MFRASHPVHVCDYAHFSPDFLVSFAMAKRRTEDAQPRGASKPMQPPPDQRAVGSPHTLAPLNGIEVGLPLSPTRAAAARHSQEATQPAPNSPAPMQQDTPPRLSQRPTQPMEFTLTPTKDKGTAGKAPPRHSQETTQPSTSQLVDLYTRYREKLDNEEELIRECTAQYQQTGKGQSTAPSYGQPIGLGFSPFGSVPADWGMPRGPRRRHFSTDSPYQQYRGCRYAQLSSDAPHPDELTVTPRRSIGGRCRKWAVSTQDSSSTNKRACAACTRCGKQLAPWGAQAAAMGQS